MAIVDGVAHRYGLLPAAGSATTATVIVDVGGPGSSPLAGAGLAGVVRSYEPALRSYNVVVIEEPWVTTALPSGCDEALSAFLVAARTRDEADRVGGRLTSRCDLGELRWGFDPTSYATLLGQIEADADLHLVGFVGTSFGSVRWLYSQPERFSWTVLRRPFPLAVTAPALLAERAALIDRVSPVPNGIEPGSSVDDRSVPISELDLVAARVNAAGVGGTLRTARDVGGHSDALWQRYGVDQLAPGLLAYWQEVCVDVAGWTPAHWDGTAGDTAGFLELLHAPCASVPPVAPPPVPRTANNVCAIVGRFDPVATGLAGPQLEHIGAKVILSDAAPHTSGDRLELCPIPPNGATPERASGGESSGSAEPDQPSVPSPSP